MILAGIGRAVARSFAKEGCRSLALLDINTAGLEETKHLISTSHAATILRVETYQLDLTSETAIASTYKSIQSTFGRIDYAINCAGVITFDAPSASCSLEIFDRDNAINYRGVWLCSRAAIQIMLNQSLDAEIYADAEIPAHRAQRGSIVNIASGMALRHQRGCPVYSASKAGVWALSRGDGVDYAQQKIRVNAVLPGLVDSPMTQVEGKREALEGRVNEVVPMKRFGMPDEVADVCLFLAGNRASYVTAAAWGVDGGRGGV